jgi:TonB-linked SusC/RagA family outer membrane protein
MLSLLMFSFQLFAQNRTITGKVTDENGSPVSSASIVVKGTKIGTTTSADGTYSLSVPSNAKALLISSVNFEPSEAAIGSGNIVNVTIKSTSSVLGEVVVVGYGTARKVGSTVGSIATVSAAKIQDRPNANSFDALQGKVAGLQVFTSNGEPSASSSIRLHGVGSLGASSTPLIVMDGAPIDQGTIISLDPNDFETISVLKDASATSIYGSRAANGVIYITTKKGSPNKPATITLQTQYGVSNLANTDFFNDFMNTKQLTDFWVATGYRTQSQIDNLLTTYPSDTKWYKYYYEDNVPMKQVDLSISGGGGKTSYYISGSYLDQPGLAYRSGYKRYTLRSNLTTTVNNWFKMGLNLFMGDDERQTNPYGTNNTNRGLALLAAPFYSPLDASGELIYGLIPGWNRYAPKYLADKIQGKDNNVQFNPSAYIQINPIKNLTLKTQAALEAYDYRSSTVQLPSYAGSLNNGNASESYTRGVTTTVTNTGEYKFTVAQDHNFTALIGQEFVENKTPSFNTSSSGQSDDRLVLLSNGPNNRTSNSSNSEYAYLSYFSRLEYNYQNKYFVDGSFRQDQSSRFGKDNRTANFWSAGVMWKAKREDFLSKYNWLTDLTVRANTGTTGNSAIGNYQSLPLVGTNTYDNNTGWNISAAGNPLLSWETQRTTTFGLNFVLFDRLRVDASYYIRKTSDMLISVPYPYTSGFSSITSNVGTLKNSGIDLSIDADVLKTKDAYITPYINLNYNKDEVTSLFQGKQYWIIPNTGVSWAIGQPVSFFYPIFKGVDPQTGLPQWYNPNSDPDKIVYTKKDPNDVTSTFSPNLQQNTGIKRYPPLNGGFGLTAGYKSFFVNADFTFSQGKYLINNDRYFYENPNQFPGYNQSKVILDYWQKPGDVTRFPKYGIQFTQFDSRLVENASFMRMKVVTIGYNFPNSILSKSNFFKSARFYVTGRNLLTFTKYSGPDPEVDSNLSLGANPNTKQVAVGLDLTF